MAYLSCVVSGDVAFPRQIFKCEWEETFEKILVRLKADRESRSTVLKTEISATDIFHPAHIVDLDMYASNFPVTMSVLLSAIRMTTVRELVCGGTPCRPIVKILLFQAFSFQALSFLRKGNNFAMISVCTMIS